MSGAKSDAQLVKCECKSRNKNLKKIYDFFDLESDCICKFMRTECDINCSAVESPCVNALEC